MVDHNRDRSDDEAQDDQTTEDSNDTMSDYNFIGDDDESEDTTEQSTDDGGWNWGLGDHSTLSGDQNNYLAESIEGTMEKLDDDVEDDLVEVLQDAQDLVNSTDISRFECSHEDCGLGHSHPDGKHDIRSHHESSGIPGFNIEAAFADQMEFVPYCHCGANEAAMLVKFFSYIDVPMFKDQHEFEGVLEVEPDVLEAIYRRFNEEGESVSRAVARVATRRGEPESEVAPLGLREDLKLFLDRRQQMEQQAQKAPIAQETRATIEEARKRLEERTSQ